MNARAKGQQPPRQQTNVGGRRKRRDKEGRGAPGHIAAGQITIRAIMIVRVEGMANHFMPGIVLSVFHGLHYSTSQQSYDLGIAIYHHFIETRAHF